MLICKGIIEASVAPKARPAPAGNIPTTVQISELVIKVVRELGQPELALAFAGAGTQAAQDGDSKSRPTTTLEQDAAVRVGPLLQELGAWVEAVPAPGELAWRTARIRSLDSATGLLYVLAALILAGEIAARTLFFLTDIAT